MADIDSDRATVAARVPFVTAIDGPPHGIKEGAVYAADHPVVLGNPTRFGPVNVRERPGTAASAAVRQAAERPRSVDAPEPPTAEERIVDLVRAQRAELDALATAAGVENPEALANKREVAEAIIAAVARPEDKGDEPIVGGLEGGAGRASDESSGPSTLEDATDEQLATIAGHYDVEVVPDDRDATIAAIKARAGYRTAGSEEEPVST
jgi:hypothetical protein